MDSREYQDFVHLRCRNAYDRESIKEKLADSLFVITHIASVLGISLEQLTRLSYEKERDYLSKKENEIQARLAQYEYEQMIFNKENIEEMKAKFNIPNLSTDEDQVNG